MLGRGKTHKGKSAEEEEEEEKKWRRGEEGEGRVDLLWYAGLESLIHWHASSLIQSNANILREENKRYHSNCICVQPAAVTVRGLDR